MNPYSRILANAPSEIDEFSQSKYGKQWEPSWYFKIKEHIQKAIEAESSEEAEKILRTVLHMITDSGPITAEISQSLSIAINSLQTKQKRKTK
jgi:hypothetical protein